MLFSSTLNHTTFINFWNNLTTAEKNVFANYANENSSDFLGGISIKAGSFLNWAFEFLLDNPDVSISNFENWFMGTSEGQDGEITGNTDIDLSSFYYQPRQMPTYQQFINVYPKKNYPGYPGYFSQMPASEVYELVGNPLYNLFITSGGNQGNYRNACPVRWSYAMNRLGINIPQNSQSLRGADYNGMQQFYYFRASTVDDAMEKIFGPPTHKLTGNDANNPEKIALFLKGKTGIYVSINNSPSTANFTGHVDLIQNGHIPGGANVYNIGGGVKSIKIWNFSN